MDECLPFVNDFILHLDVAEVKAVCKLPALGEPRKLKRCAEANIIELAMGKM